MSRGRIERMILIMVFLPLLGCDSSVNNKPFVSKIWRNTYLQVGYGTDIDSAKKYALNPGLTYVYLDVCSKEFIEYFLEHTKSRKIKSIRIICNENISIINLSRLTHLNEFSFFSNTSNKVNIKFYPYSRLKRITLDYPSDQFLDYDNCYDDLEELFVSGNFAEIPFWIDNLSCLKEIYVSSHNLKIYNFRLCEMDSLRKVKFYTSMVVPKDIDTCNNIKLVFKSWN